MRMVKIIHSQFNVIRLLLFTFFIAVPSLNSGLRAQVNEPLTATDKSALENIIVEKYYVAEETDYADISGGVLPKGSVTYRIYVDLKPGYNLQMVYGDKKHELFIRSTTTFFNNVKNGSY